MISRELKINFKSLIIWALIVTIILTMVFLMYPTIIGNSSEADINDIIRVMPENLLAAFNIDIVDLGTVVGFFKSEGIVLLMLIYSIYAGQLGSTILLKEESDKTIEFLYSKPISKNDILKSKIIAGLINIVSFVIIISIIIVIGLILSNEPVMEIIVLNLSLLMPSILIFFITLFLSTYFRRTKQTIAISYGLVFFSYFLLIFSNMSEKISFLKVFSVYTLADIRNQVSNSSFNEVNIIIFFVVVFMFIILSCIKYNKKEFLN